MILRALSLVLLATPAVAACPVPADMDGAGVRFTAETGDVETFTRSADGVTQSTVESRSKPMVRAELAKGLYLTRIYDVVDGGSANEVSYSYPTALGNLPEPFAQGALTLTVEGTDDQGKFKSTETYTFGAASGLTIGTCAFEMIPVELTYAGTDQWDLFHYLPEYGLSYLAATFAADGAKTDYSFNDVMGLR
ncbi:hypothetical protein [Maritimibacter sp. UBA3975]|uniref:hypothetical protein n=1 Tax=Maritimibacter sp. UBA3975 TaxID=1946833 RepID=UPI0025C5FD0C|nr:hypothetical protein [Maritimibacter sp. UBA3975]